MRPAAAPLIFERLHPWHVRFVRYEARRGRTIRFRSLDDRTERSAEVAELMAAGTLAPLQLATPVIAYMHPATELAFAFIDEHFARTAGRSPVVARAAAVFSDHDVALAYRKALADTLTTYFHLALLADASATTLGRDVQLVPDTLRDATAFEVGHELTRNWSHPDHRRPALEAPGWTRLAAGGHAALRTLRARLAIGSLALTGGVPHGGRSAAAVAFAIVSAPRDVPAGSRSAEFLVDGERLKRSDCVFVPLTPLADRDREVLVARGLTVASAHGHAPDRRGYLATLAATVNAPGWMTRATVELLRAHGRWSHFTATHDVGTFVSRADTGVEAVARSLVLRRAGVRTVGYSDSGNFGFHPGQTQSSRAPSIAHFAYLIYDDFATWNDRMLRYLAGHRQEVRRYHVIGCPWSDHIAAYRREREGSGILRGLRSRGVGKDSPIVAFFDSWYHPHGLNQADDLAAFLSDVLRLLEERADVVVLMKKKVPIVFPERDAERIYALHDRIAEHPRAHLFEPGGDTSEIAAISDAVISFPFTSVTHEALGAGIPGAIYDARSKLRGWYHDLFPGLLLHGFDELRLGLAEMLDAPEDYLARIAASQERPTELNLELGALRRLREIVVPDYGAAGSGPPAPRAASHEPA